MCCLSHFCYFSRFLHVHFGVQFCACCKFYFPLFLGMVMLLFIVSRGKIKFAPRIILSKLDTVVSSLIQTVQLRDVLFIVSRGKIKFAPRIILSKLDTVVSSLIQTVQLRDVSLYNIGDSCSQVQSVYLSVQ